MNTSQWNQMAKYRLFFILSFLITAVNAQVLDTTIVEGLEKPGSIEASLNKSIPQRESLFKGFIMPDNYDEWKEEVYKETTIKLSIGYQGNLMWATNTISDPSRAASGLFQFQAEWTPINYDKDYEGGLVVSYNNIHTYGSSAQPPLFLLNTGSIFPHDGLYLEASFIANLYWEQWFKKDRFFIRIGQHVPPNIIDFSRFADVRTSVTNPAIGFPAGNIPFGPPAIGISAKLLPKNPTGFYFVGHVSDVNSVVDELNWGNIFEFGDLFIAGELGHNWLRIKETGPEFDHVHLLVYRADRPSNRAFPSKDGWGFKLSGEKQIGKWVTLLSYGYNTAAGGGFGFTNLNHVINAGVAYTKPFGIKGEAFLAFTWGEELDEGQCGGLPCLGRNQSMMEAYWKILVLPELWLTPGMQFHFNPANNPNTGLVWLPLLKFRFFL